MRRPLFCSLFALAFAGTALAGPTLDDLAKDPAKKKELDKGAKALENYFKAEAEQAKGGGKAAAAGAAMVEAQEKFLEWLGTTTGSVGLDLRGQPDIVIQMMDRARLKYLTAKFKKGSIEYVKVDNAKGMKRHEYAILVPGAYDPNKGKIPVVVSLHGRVINPKHPAFRGPPFDERAREAVWNNWFKTAAAESVLVLAPTTDNNGFQFQENHGDELQALYRTLGEALTEYRGDWDRIFLEVHGRGFRVALEQALVFAGIIVRDRPDDKTAPFVAPEHFFLLENLNGVPLCYVADAANWAKVGKPLADALTDAYAKAGKPENLVVIQAQRDVDGALRGGEDKIQAFVQAHERVKTREKFTWRFFDATQANPFPLGLNANFILDVDEAARKAPLSAKAGRLSFEVKREAVEGQEVNRVEVQVTEAEGLSLALVEPLLNLDLPVMINVNGATVLKPQKFERDWDLFFDKVLGLRFFMLPVLGETSATFALKPEFVSPEQPKPAEGAEQKAPDGTPAGAPGGADGDKKMSGR